MTICLSSPDDLDPVEHLADFAFEARLLFHFAPGCGSQPFATLDMAAGQAPLSSKGGPPAGSKARGPLDDAHAHPQNRSAPDVFSSWVAMRVF